MNFQWWREHGCGSMLYWFVNAVVAENKCLIISLQYTECQNIIYSIAEWFSGFPYYHSRTNTWSTQNSKYEIAVTYITYLNFDSYLRYVLQYTLRGAVVNSKLFTMPRDTIDNRLLAYMYIKTSLSILRRCIWIRSEHTALHYSDGCPAMNTKCLVPLPFLPDLILWSTENRSHGSPVLVPPETQ